EAPGGRFGSRNRPRAVEWSKWDRHLGLSPHILARSTHFARGTAVRKSIVLLIVLAVSGCAEGGRDAAEEVANLLADGLESADPIQACSEAIAREPLDLGAYRQRGDAYAVRGEHDKAIADYSRVLQLAPDAVTYYNRGVQYSMRGLDEQALADYGEAIRLDPRHAAAHFNRGLAHRALEDFEAALRLD